MCKVKETINFQPISWNIYGEETYQINYKACFWSPIIHRTGRNHSKLWKLVDSFCTQFMLWELITDARGGKKIFPDTRFTPKKKSRRDAPLYPIKYYSSVSGGLRETKTAIWVQGSICYPGYGSVKSTVSFLNFSRIMQLDICVRALERIANKKSRLFYSSESFHGRR